jgi:chaperonin GroES
MLVENEPTGKRRIQMAKDILARGGRTATFAAGVGTGKAELKNLSSEPRNTTKEIKIDRSRSYSRIIPKGDMLQVDRRDPEIISAGGVLIPDETLDKDRPAEGVVISIGPKVEDVKKGDYVIFGKYAGVEYQFGAEKILFMREDEIIATVEGQ